MRNGMPTTILLCRPGGTHGSRSSDTYSPTRSGVNRMSLLTFEKRDNVALIGLNDPEHLNATSMTMIEELHEVLTREAAAGTRRFVFHRHGPSFSSGAH